MRHFFLVVLLAGAAFADILPDEVDVCRGKTAGAACTTPEGQAGTCAEISVSRPDYSSGIPPKYTQVKMLGCVAVAKASSKVALPWVGVGLAFLAMLAAFGASAVGRSRPSTPLGMNGLLAISANPARKVEAGPAVDGPSRS